MPIIPEETIESVKAASDIVDVISAHVQLRQQGRNWVGLCPFHNEKTPSFSVSPGLGIYHCFGCGVGGDVLKFVQEIDKVSFVEAVSFLAERAGIRLPQRGADPQEDRNDHLFRANELAARYFHHMLRQPQGAGALRYVHERGLADATIDAFRIGYAPSGWTGLLGVAGRRGFTAEVLEQAGLALASPKSRGHYDRFRDRVVFPIASLSGRVIAFGARALRPDDEPKYLNSPETPIYRKGGVLYGMARARDAIRRERTALVVEGYMDVASLAQHGIDNVVASSGTALTAAHAHLLARYAERVVLLFDGDAAGGTAAERGVEVLLGTELDTRIVALPDEHDPDTFIRRDGGATQLRALVDAAPPAFDVYLDRVAAAADLTSVAGRARAVERLIPLFAECAEEVRRDLMLRRVAQRFGVGEPALRRDVAAALARPRRHSGAEAEQASGPAPRQVRADGTPRPATEPELERHLLGLLLQRPELIAESARRLEGYRFVDRPAGRLMSLLVERHAGDRSIDLTSLLNTVDETMGRLVSTCAMESIYDDTVRDVWLGLVSRLRWTQITRRLDDLQRQLVAAQELGRDEERDRLWEEVRRLTAERQRVEIRHYGS